MTHVDSPAFSHVDAPATPDPTPDAPHGYKPDGTPYQRSQEWRKNASDKMTAGRNGKPKAPTAPPRKRAAPQARKAVTYADVVGGMMQMLAGGLMIAGKMMPVMQAHAVAVTMHAEPIAKAVESVALEDSRVAAVLDRVSTVGPYGALVMAIVPLGMQMLANHGLIPPNQSLGIYDPVELLKEAGIDVPSFDEGPNVPHAPDVSSD